MRTYGLEVHQPIEPPYPLGVDLMSEILSEIGGHTGHAQPGMAHELFIYLFHQLQVEFALTLGLVVEPTAMYLHQLALPCHAEGVVLTLDQLPPLSVGRAQDKARFKKSISIFCWPIVLSILSFSRSSSLLASFPGLSKTVSALSRNCLFQVVI